MLLRIKQWGVCVGRKSVRSLLVVLLAFGGSQEAEFQPAHVHYLHPFLSGTFLQGIAE